jgi:hypothetical protein
MVRKCNHHHRPHGCRYGIKCEFAHSKEEELLESKAELHSYRSLAAQDVKTRFIRGEIISKIIHQKNRWEANANATWSSAQTNSWWHKLQKPVQHVTWDNKNDLSSVPYMVSPKADGVRKILLCERSAGDIYLIGTNNKKPVQVAGAKGSWIRGFVLDTEEVILSSGDRLVVAFDVLAIDSSAVNMLARYPSTRSSSVLRKAKKVHKVLTINSLEQRYQLLKEIVATVSMSHLIVKPLWPTSETEFVWKMSSSLPYPVDGLIFVPMSAKNSSSKKNLTFKWKPTDKLTIDLAVGSAITNEPRGEVFIPYLHAPSSRWEGGHPTSSRDLGLVIHHGHAPFHLDCRNRAEVCVQVEGEHYGDFSELLVEREETEREETANDIHLINVKDLDAINRQRKLENELWLEESGNCGNEDCFCTEVLPSGNSVSHCILCGVLVVNTHEACLNCNGQVARPIIEESSVLIPPDDSAWAAHQIIEVHFDICTATFRFIRIRRDRLVANSPKQIKYILELQLRPVGLSDLSFHSFDQLGEMVPRQQSAILTKGEEAEMSAMYSAAVVFQKRRGKRVISTSAFETLPQVTVFKIFSFLPSKDLATLRALSTTFRSEVDHLGNLKWFNTIPKSVLYQDADDHVLYSDILGRKRIDLSPCTIASFLRLGGELRPIQNDDDDADDAAAVLRRYEMDEYYWSKYGLWF